MNNREILNRFARGGLLTLILFFTLNLYSKFKEEKVMLRHYVQVVFEEAVQKDTDRRSAELGDSFKLFYSPIFNKDTITIKSVDTIIYIKSNKGIAQKMSDKEKINFSIQLFLATENSIQVDSLDSLYRSSLTQLEIPAQTAVIYTFNNKSMYSCGDSSFYQSAEALDEITFGPVKTIIVQAFVKIPFRYIVKKAVLSNGLFILIWVLALILALWLIFCKKGREIQIIPAPEAPKTMIEIMPGLLLDETHGVLQSGDRKVVLINLRLKLFLLLLEHKGYYIETDKLLETIWPDGSVSKDALSSTVKRLKEDLALFPEILIESGRGRGYMLSLVDKPETAPDLVP